MDISTGIKHIHHTLIRPAYPVIPLSRISSFFCSICTTSMTYYGEMVILKNYLCPTIEQL